MPEWLPDMLCVNPWTENTYEKLYNIFCRDIRDSDLRYFSKAVWIFLELDDGKESVFWHLTSRTTKPIKIPRRKRKFYSDDQTYIEEERLPDLRRCERLPWIKALIEHSSEPEVRAWDYEEGNRTIKTYVWLKEYDFVVIMKKYPDGKRRLITSFYVDSLYKQKDFERKYVKRLN
ncbi:MAG TPA: hypothetical protein ENG80_01240 [Nitrospirae bacterium]|nr:hypothetical protein [Nitrospirota bacterium]